MRFGAPLWLHLLWLVPILFAILLWRIRRTEAQLGAWCDRGLWTRMVPERRGWAPYVKGVLLLLALTLLIVAAARPQIGSKVVAVERSGIDVMVALDVSESMLAEDLKPNRITRAKQEIGSLIERLRGDRIGLIAFSGDAFVQCPLTLDYAAARMFLRFMDTGLVPIPGTAISRAVDVAADAYETDDDKFKALVLITDGEDHEGEMMEAARAAGEKGVRIFAVGIGTEQGEPIPIRDAQGNLRDYKRDQNGEAILSRCDAEALNRICRETGGRYFDGTSAGLALDRLYAEISSMEERELEGGWATEYEDRYGYFVAVALGLLLLEWLIANRRRRGAAVRRLSAAALLFLPLCGWVGSALRFLMVAGLLLGLGMGAGTAWADTGTQAYEDGNYQEARDYYEEYSRENPEDARADFNLGTTLHQTRELDPATSALQRALRSEDPLLRSKALYNLGNTQVRQGDLEAARESFRMSLLHNPSDRDAKTNFEIIDRILQESPPDSSQQQSDQQNQDQQDQEDQENQDQQDQDQQNQDQQDQQDQQNQDQQNQDQQNQDEQDQQQQDQQNQDQQNQDQQDQQNQDSENEDQQDPDQNGNPQDQDPQQQDEQDSQGQSPQEQQPPPKIPPQEALRLLEALGQQEMQLQQERMKAKAKTRKVEKDW